jgi:hypothetical protein
LLDVINANLASVGNIPFTIDVPLTFNFDSSVSGGGEAFFNVGATGTSLSLSPTHLVYQYPSSDRVVPERSNWATMLLGFLGLGYAGYRK